MSIRQPLQQDLNTFFSHAPQPIEVIAILVFGYVVARLLLPIAIRLLDTVGFQRSMKRGRRKPVLRPHEHQPEVHQHSGQAGVLANDFTMREGGGSPPDVADRCSDEGRDLVRASDLDSALGDRALDVCRRVVRDRDGQEIGTLEDLYVDTDGVTARFLIVDTSIALGLDGRFLLIPLEAVGGISADRVTLNQDRDKIADSPSFEQKAEVDHRYQTAIYCYYGYFWAQADEAAEYAAS